MVAITPVLRPVTLFVLQLWFITNFETPRRNINGTWCRLYNLTKRVFPRVDLVNRTLPPVTTLIGRFLTRVKLAIKAALNLVPNLANLSVLMTWVTILWMLHGACALGGMTLSRLLMLRVGGWGV